MALVVPLCVGLSTSPAGAGEEAFPAAPPLDAPTAPEPDPLDPATRLKALDDWARGSFLDPEIKARNQAEAQAKPLAARARPQARRSAVPPPIQAPPQAVQAPPQMFWQPRAFAPAWSPPAYCAPGGG